MDKYNKDLEKYKTAAEGLQKYKTAAEGLQKYQKAVSYIQWLNININNIINSIKLITKFRLIN